MRKAEDLSRRDFLRVIATGGLASFVKFVDFASANQGQSSFLIDTTRCKYCNRCIEACAEKHGSTHAGTFYTHVTLTYPNGQTAAPLPVPFHCMHCSDPPCVNVCQGGALSKTPLGAVTLDQSRCVGCLSCINACPFSQTLHYDAGVPPKIFKCDMCYDLLVEGSKPACVEACEMAQHDALSYGPSDEIVSEAMARASELDGLVLYPSQTHTLLLFRKQEFNEPMLREIYGVTEHYSVEARAKAGITRLARLGWIPVAGGLAYYILNWRRNRLDELVRIREDTTGKGD
jgi:formate dehydrogenase iron-sulfur subunit